MNEYERLQHTLWECKYHVVFIPSSFTNLEAHMLIFSGDRDPICCVSAEFQAGFVNLAAKINLPKIPVTRRINNLAYSDW